jgi:hypothetical protein
MRHGILNLIGYKPRLNNKHIFIPSSQERATPDGFSFRGNTHKYAVGSSRIPMCEDNLRAEP